MSGRRAALRRGREDDALKALRSIVDKGSRQWHEGVSLEKGQELLGALNALPAEGMHVGTKCYDFVADYLLRNKRVSLAFTALREKDAQGLPDTPATRGIRMECIAATEGSRGAKSYLQSLQDDGIALTSRVYLPALRLFNAKEAAEAFVAMGRLSLQPSIAHFNAALEGVPTERSAPILQEMRRCGLTPDADIYTTLIGGAGTVEAAEAVFDLMIRKQLRPSQRTYSRLANAYKQCGDYEGVRKVLHRKAEAGYDLGVHDYGTLLKACQLSGMQGMVQEAEKVYAEARLRGLFSQLLAARLMEVYQIHGEKARADALLETLKGENVRMHPAIRAQYNELLRRNGEAQSRSA